MGQKSLLILLTMFVVHAYSAPQFITFQDGKLGVNFGGYHAGVGLGGILGGGTAGGLFAEAGTPQGQAARAGLGGAVGSNGGAAGGLFAGATAGGNVKAAAGLSGGVDSEKSAGTGFASALAGNHYAASGMGGEESLAGSTGFSISGSKSFGVPTTVVKETEVSVVPVETVKPVQTNINAAFQFDAINEVKPLPPVVELEAEAKSALETKSTVESDVNVKTQPEVIVKEVYVQQPPQVIEKHIIHTHYKPRRQHFRKTAYLGGYIGGGADVGLPPPPPTPVVFKAVQPAIQKRVDVGVESYSNGDVLAEVDSHGGSQGDGAGQVAFRKEVTYQSNPNLFRDIFNIPISTLQAVGHLLSNTAANTNISVQKSASVQADSDSISPKRSPSSSASQTESHISIQTPTVSKIIDDIFAIPINTLGAVNKFLENNVQARKKVQVSEDGTVEPAKARFGPHARRRANKRVVVVQENVASTESSGADDKRE